MEIKAETYQQAIKSHAEFEASRRSAVADLTKQRDRLDSMIEELEGLGKNRDAKPAERKCGKCGASGHSARTCMAPRAEGVELR